MRQGRGVARWARACLAAVALACFGGLLAPWLSRSLGGRGDALAWAIDLAAHWQWLFLAMMVAAILPAVALGGRRWALLLIAAPLPWLSAAPPLASAPTHASAAAHDGGQVLTVASANVFYRNHDPARLRAWVDRVRPDVVVIVEISHRFARAIETAQWEDFPYRQVSPAADAFGVAVLSRHPLDAAAVWRDRQASACCSPASPGGIGWSRWPSSTRCRRSPCVIIGSATACSTA